MTHLRFGKHFTSEVLVLPPFLKKLHFRKCGAKRCPLPLTLEKLRFVSLKYEGPVPVTRNHTRLVVLETPGAVIETCNIPPNLVRLHLRHDETDAQPPLDSMHRLMFLHVIVRNHNVPPQTRKWAINSALCQKTCNVTVYTRSLAIRIFDNSGNVNSSNDNDDNHNDRPRDKMVIPKFDPHTHRAFRRSGVAGIIGCRGSGTSILLESFIHHFTTNMGALVLVINGNGSYLLDNSNLDHRKGDSIAHDHDDNNNQSRIMFISSQREEQAIDFIKKSPSKRFKVIVIKALPRKLHPKKLLDMVRCCNVLALIEFSALRYVPPSIRQHISTVFHFNCNPTEISAFISDGLDPALIDDVHKEIKSKPYQCAVFSLLDPRVYRYRCKLEQ